MRLQYDFRLYGGDNDAIHIPVRSGARQRGGAVDRRRGSRGLRDHRRVVEIV
jgi:hypothetical protein